MGSNCNYKHNCIASCIICACCLTSQTYPLKGARSWSYSPSSVPTEKAQTKKNNTASAERQWPHPPDLPWQSKILTALMKTNVRVSLWKSCLRILNTVPHHCLEHSCKCGSVHHLLVLGPCNALSALEDKGIVEDWGWKVSQDHPLSLLKVEVLISRSQHF